MFKEQTLSTLLDGHVEDNGLFCHGTYKGLNFIIKPFNNAYTIVISAFNENDAINAELQNYLKQYKVENKKQIKDVSVTRYDAYLSFSAKGKKEQLGENINELLKPVFAYLVTNGYHSCCENCGNDNETVACYNINGTPTWLCQQCAITIADAYQQNKQEKQNINSNPITGAVGALIGALVGGVAWILIGKVGLMSGLAGLVGVVLAFRLYDKFGNGLDIKGVVISMVIVLIVLYVANRLGWAWELYDAIKDYGYSFSDCFANLSEYLKLIEVYDSYIMDIVVGLALTVVGTIGNVISTVKGVSGKYNITKL